MANLMSPQQIERLLKEIHELTKHRQAGKAPRVRHCAKCGTPTWHDENHCLTCRETRDGR